MATSSAGSRTRTVKTSARGSDPDAGRQESAPTTKLPAMARARTQPQGSPSQPRARMPSAPPPSKPADGGAYSVVTRPARGSASDLEPNPRRVKVGMLRGRVKLEVGDQELTLSRREAGALLEQLYAALK